MKQIILSLFIGLVLAFPGYAEVYKWVDEKGTVHFADDLSRIPEKYRPDARIQHSHGQSELPASKNENGSQKDSGIFTGKPSGEISVAPAPESQEKPTSPRTLGISEPEGIEAPLTRRGGVFVTEVTLNGRVKRHFVVDTGASDTVISQETAKELDLPIDEDTPFVVRFTASDVIFVPLVTLKSVRVGNAEVEGVEATVQTMPSGDGLLGQSFLSRFRVILDAAEGKMTLSSTQGSPSPDRPGGYDRDYWISQFRLCHENLAGLKKIKAKAESQGSDSLLRRVNHTIRYFENRLDDLERKASFAGVPRNWRE